MALSMAAGGQSGLVLGTMSCSHNQTKKVSKDGSVVLKLYSAGLTTVLMRFPKGWGW